MGSCHLQYPPEKVWVPASATPKDDAVDATYTTSLAVPLGYSINTYIMPRSDAPWSANESPMAMSAGEGEGVVRAAGKHGAHEHPEPQA